MDNFSFNEEVRNSLPLTNQSTGMIAWLVKSGIAKNQRSANNISFVLFILTIVLAIFIFSVSSPKELNTETDSDLIPGQEGGYM